LAAFFFAAGMFSSTQLRSVSGCEGCRRVLTALQA
jgi:hypothetical protein